MLSKCFSNRDECMQRITAVWFTSLVILFGTRARRAEISIEQLVQESGLKAGPVAGRVNQGWRTPRRIWSRATAAVLQIKENLLLLPQVMRY